MMLTDTKPMFGNLHSHSAASASLHDLLVSRR